MLSISSQDTDRKQNYDGQNDGWNDRWNDENNDRQND